MSNRRHESLKQGGILVIFEPLTGFLQNQVFFPMFPLALLVSNRHPPIALLAGRMETKF